MKKITVFMFLIFAISFATSQTKVTSKSFPTNFNKTDFEDLNQRNGHMIAFDGVIKDRQISRNNTPFYLLDLGEGKTIWTVLVFKNEKNKVGDNIRVVGYLTDIIDKRRQEDFLGDSVKMVMALGLVDFENQNFLFADGADNQRNQWIAGEIPTQ